MSTQQFIACDLSQKIYNYFLSGEKKRSSGTLSDSFSIVKMDRAGVIVSARGRGSSQNGLTLVEMMGVLAIVALLAGLLVPQVLTTVKDARTTAAALGAKTLQTAAIGYFGHYAQLAGINGESLTFDNGVYENWDGDILISEGFLSAPFEPPLGENADVWLLDETGIGRLGAITGIDTVTPFDLDGDGTTDTQNAKQLALAVITGVRPWEALAVNRILDGEAMNEDHDSAPSDGVDDAGHVVYPAPTDGKTTLYIYLCHTDYP